MIDTNFYNGASDINSYADFDTYNRDIFKCECGGIFRYVYTYNPLEGIKNDREYRTKCINEMRKMWVPRESPS